MLLARKPLFLLPGQDSAILYQAGSAVVVKARDAENDHSLLHDLEVFGTL